MKPWWTIPMVALTFTTLAGRVPNGNFAENLDRWELQPVKSTAKVEDVESHGKVLALSAVDANSGLTSGLIPIAPAERSAQWTLQFEIQSEPIPSGVFAASVYAVNADGKMLKQMGLYHLSAKSSNNGSWQKISKKFGRDTRFALPPETTALRVRFSFWDASGKCRGAVRIAAVELTNDAAAPGPCLTNGNFDDGMNGWKLRPAGSTVAVKPLPPYGNVLEIVADKANSGIVSQPVKMQEDERNQPWLLTVRMQADPVVKGSFGVSLYALNADGKELKQIMFYSLRAGKEQPWKTIRFRFGAGTKKPLPEGTAGFSVRFSFWDAQGDPSGTARVTDISVTPVSLP